LRPYSVRPKKEWGGVIDQERGAGKTYLRMYSVRSRKGRSGSNILENVFCKVQKGEERVKHT